jgi:hypothetical protein
MRGRGFIYAIVPGNDGGWGIGLGVGGKISVFILKRGEVFSFSSRVIIYLGDEEVIDCLFDSLVLI